MTIFKTQIESHHSIQTINFDYDYGQILHVKQIRLNDQESADASRPIQLQQVQKMSSGKQDGGRKRNLEYGEIGPRKQGVGFFSPMADAESSNSSCPSLIGKIPQDHLFSILLLLPTESILCFGMTCKKFKSLAYSESLWEAVCNRDWGPTAISALKGSNQSQQLPWMKLYKQVYHFDSVFCRRLLAEGPDGNEIIPQPRASHSLNLISGFLILFGGGCEGGRHLDDTWLAYIGDDLSRTTLKWQKVNSSRPSGRFGHSSVVIGDFLVLFGGINDHGIRHNDTWIGQVKLQETIGVTFSWRLLDVGTNAPPARGAHAGCTIDTRRMLIHGGIGPSGLRLGDTWVLNLSEDLTFGTWTEVVTEPCPPSRSGHTLTYIGGGQSVLFGGRGMRYQVLNDVWLLDSSQENLEWAQLLFEIGNIPHGFSLPRVGHSANLIIGRRLLIYGGEDSYRHRKDDFWVLDISSMAPISMQQSHINQNRKLRKMWRRVDSRGDTPNCRAFHCACVDASGRFLYVHGGMVDGLVVQPADPSSLRFDGEWFLLELLQLT